MEYRVVGTAFEDHISCATEQLCRGRDALAALLHIIRQSVFGYRAEMGITNILSVQIAFPHRSTCQMSIDSGRRLRKRTSTVPVWYCENRTANLIRVPNWLVCVDIMCMFHIADLKGGSGHTSTFSSLRVSIPRRDSRLFAAP